MANDIILEKAESAGEHNPSLTSTLNPEDSEYHSCSFKQLQIRLDRLNAYFPYREETSPIPSVTWALSASPSFRETIIQQADMRPTTTTKLSLSSLAPASFLYFPPSNLSFTGEIRLDIKPLMSIPPKLSVHFLALLPGQDRTLRVRMFPYNGLQDVLITRNEGEDKVEVRFLRVGMVIAQQVIEGLMKPQSWEPSPAMDKLKGETECVFVGELGGRARQAWAGFVEEFDRAKAGRWSPPPPQTPPPPPPKDPPREPQINYDEEVEAILHNAISPSNSPKAIKSNTVILPILSNIPAESEWLTADRPPPPSLPEPPRSVLLLHLLHLVTPSHYVTYSGSSETCIYPLSLTLDTYFRELSLHIPGVAPTRIDIPISFESGFTWRFHDTERNVLVMRVQGGLAHPKEGVRKPDVAEGSRKNRFWEEYHWVWTEGGRGMKDVLGCGETIWIHAEGKGGIRAVGEFASEIEEVRWGRRREERGC
ncbi:hypothetical protein BDD12DRAFT_832886 [Trichophaea hybrida]|nr:hypothetical protein BDD12DRAFT_832886 [Trichophaea hybrida]